MFVRRAVAGLFLTTAAFALITGTANADAEANGAGVGSPGVISGNVIQVPIQIPINLCSDTINIIGLLNPASGNTCVNG